LAPETLWRFCEEEPRGPLYFLPTREWIAALVRVCRRLGRVVVEVGAGDGFVSRCLARAAPELRVIATDSGAWTRPSARMNAAERRRLRGAALPGIRLGPNVLRLGAVEAVRRFRPDVVLAVWLPPGPLFSRLVRAPCRYVLEIGVPGGVTGEGNWGWRFAHEPCEGAIEARARCRLDAPPTLPRTRVTLAFGRRHPEYREERPRAGDWLWQFRPRESR
ncbi:MAG: class I SAM-dependent methyltransferase, partial [Deltaproteobacteria bacterium]